MEFQKFTKQNDFSWTQQTPSIQPDFIGCVLWTGTLHNSGNITVSVLKEWVTAIHILNPGELLLTSFWNHKYMQFIVTCQLLFYNYILKTISLPKFSSSPHLLRTQQKPYFITGCSSNNQTEYFKKSILIKGMIYLFKSRSQIHKCKYKFIHFVESHIL